MKISIVIPSRNNLRFLQQAYYSIRKNIIEQHEIIILDDASTDGTFSWLNSIRRDDNNVVIYRNDGPDRVGHTVLYDIGVKLSTNDIFGIFHADMIASSNFISNMLKHLTLGKVVCATRIEPPLHPSGPEKHIINFGMEAGLFNMHAFLDKVTELESTHNNETTAGIFAPWIMYKSDFIAIGGHDKLFAPMELEDSDIFNRMVLAGYELIQSRDALVYHMTCRGSRFKDGIEIERVIDLPDGTHWHKPKDSIEYLELRQIKMREWHRKWHQNVLHDEKMMPIIQPRYNIGMVITNCNLELLTLLEPWSDTTYVDMNWNSVNQVYIRNEQPKTMYDLYSKIFTLEADKPNDILITVDGKTFTAEDFNIIQNLGAVINDSGEIGTFKIFNLNIEIKAMRERQRDLIVSNNNVF